MTLVNDNFYCSRTIFSYVYQFMLIQNRQQVKFSSLIEYYYYLLVDTILLFFRFSSVQKLQKNTYKFIYYFLLFKLNLIPRQVSKKNLKSNNKVPYNLVEMKIFLINLHSHNIECVCITSK